jgi:hypothetical protein
MEFHTISSLLSEHTERSFEGQPTHVERLDASDDNGAPVLGLMFAFLLDGVVYSNAVVVKADDADAFVHALEDARQQGKAMTFTVAVPPSDGDISCAVILRPAPSAA